MIKIVKIIVAVLIFFGICTASFAKVDWTFDVDMHGHNFFNIGTMDVITFTATNIDTTNLTADTATITDATVTDTLIADLYKEYSGNVIFVGQGGAYTKLSDALNSITDASSSKRYCVAVKGVVIDDTTIVAKSWVDVVGFGADITVQTDSNVHGVDFNSVTNSLWRDLIIRRKGNVTSGVYAGYFRGTTDETVIIENVEFRNEITAAVNNCYGIYFRDSASPKGTFTGYGGDGGNNCHGIYFAYSASPQGTFTGYGGDGGNSCYGIRFAYSASPQGTFTGYGGDGGDSCYGISFTDSASPKGTFTGYGGDGGDTCYGIQIAYSTSPQGTFTGYGGDGGNNCYGIYIAYSASPQGEFLAIPKNYSYIWSYSSANNGQFQPFSGKPYQLVDIAVKVSSDASAGTTLDLGTSIGGSEIASGIALDSTGWKHFDFNRAEVASDGYMYATPSASVADGSFTVYYVVVVNYSGCHGLYLNTKGYAQIQGEFYANGASDALYIGSSAISVKNWRIANSHFETYDPTNQRAVYAASSITDCPIYNSTFVGSIVNVTSFAPQVQHDLVPDTDNSYDLGSATKRFSEGYFGGSVEIPEITTSSGNLALSPASGEVEWTSVWQEQRAHITQFYKPGTNYPAQGEIGVTPVLLFDDANDEWVFYEWEVPENYDTGSDFKIRFAWAPTDANAGGVVWGIEYTVVTPNNNEVLTTTTTTETVTDSAESLANELLITDFITIPGTGVQPGDTLSMRVYRDADNGADDYGADAALIHLGLYFKIDKNGVANTS